MPLGSLHDHSGVIEYGKGIFCPGNNKTQADPLIGGNNAFMAQEGFFGKRFVRYPGEFDEELLKSMAANTSARPMNTSWALNIIMTMLKYGLITVQELSGPLIRRSRKLLL